MPSEGFNRQAATCPKGCVPPNCRAEHLNTAPLRRGTGRGLRRTEQAGAPAAHRRLCGAQAPRPAWASGGRRVTQCLLRATRSSAWLLAGVIALTWTPGQAATPADDRLAAGPDTRRVELLALTLNGVARDDAFFLVGPDDAVYASQAVVDEYALAMSGDRREVVDGDVFRPLSAIAGARWHIETAQSRLVLDVPAAAIRTLSSIDLSSAAPAVPATRSIGAFANYDLLSFGESPGADYSAAFETGVFGPWGVATNDLVYRDAVFGDDVLRLESTLSYDDPRHARTLRVGDAISRPDAIGNAVRFAGVQYGTNFATQPYLLTFPQPTLRGQTSLPSTVDVYIDNVLRGSQDVPAGGFATRALPVSTGRGTVSLQVRDALGRETLITQPFFITNELLKPGLHDFSFSAGVLRENFAIESNDYGQAVANGLWRQGLTDRVTAAVFSAAQTRAQTGGASATVKVFEAGVIQTALAGSHAASGAGLKARVGFNQQWANISYGAAIERASADYRPVGADNGLFLEARETVSANLGVSLGVLGSLAGNYVAREYYDQARIAIFNVNLSRPLGPGFASLGVFQTRSGSERGYAGQLLFTLPLGERTTASAGRHSRKMH